MRGMIPKLPEETEFSFMPCAPSARKSLNNVRFIRSRVRRILSGRAARGPPLPRQVALGFVGYGAGARDDRAGHSSRA